MIVSVLFLSARRKSTPNQNVRLFPSGSKCLIGGKHCHDRSHVTSPSHLWIGKDDVTITQITESLRQKGAICGRLIPLYVTEI